MRVFLDQGIPYSTTNYLNEAGWDVRHTVDLGMERATDQAIIDYARDNNCCCITLDADFHIVNKTTKPDWDRLLSIPELSGL